MSIANIKDVARHANVSPGTVSNALSGKRPVSPQTQQRILDSISTLGYHPDTLAQSLVNGHSRTLGVVTNHLDDYGTSRVLTGIDQQAAQNGYSILLTMVHRNNQITNNQMLTQLISHRVAGIIWAVPELWNTDEVNLAQYGDRLPPTVFVLMNPNTGLSVVNYNIVDGTTQAMQHLIRQGRKRIAHIAGPATWDSQQRTLIWYNILSEAGLPCDESYVAVSDWSVPGGEKAMHDLLNQHPDLDAVLACNDHNAIGALKVLRAANRNVPSEVSIVGYDNVPESGYVSPALTTISLPFAELGRTAVRQLCQLIDSTAQPQPQPNILLPVELVMRESA